LARRIFFLLAIGLPLLLLAAASIWIQALWGFLVVGPLVALGVYDLLQHKHSLNRIYPVVGHGRYMMEGIRPEIQQYFVETNIDGRFGTRKMGRPMGTRRREQVLNAVSVRSRGLHDNLAD